MTDPYSFAELTTLDEVAELRQAYLASLPVQPELFVELAVRESRLWAITHGGARVGYLTASEGTVNQLYLVSAHRTHADRALEQAAGALDLTRAWVCTFDALALAACFSRARAHKVLGYHYRTRLPVTLPPPAVALTERRAGPADVPLVERINHPEVFDDPTDIPVWVQSGWVTLFEGADGPMGLGLCTPCGGGSEAADIGVLVTPAYQGRGLGAWIVQRMVARGLEQGLVPTAGCAIDNEASRRTLERAGFVADYRLIEVELTATTTG